MKDWSGKSLCFECAKTLGANINIGRQFKGRCHRCHSEQTLFKATAVPVAPMGDEDMCPECAHPVGTHAAGCRRSETELLKGEIRGVVRALEEFECNDSERFLADKLRNVLRRHFANEDQ